MYVALQFTVFFGGVAVFGPPGDTSATLVRDTLRYGNCQAIVSPPFYIEAMASEPLGLKTLRDLDYIYFAGAPMSRATAEKLVPYVPVMPGMGTTESGMYFIKPRDEQDWEYYTFRESNGIEFDHLDEDMYELVLRRKPELARWQQIFQLHPEMEESRTGDIWVQHQTKPGAWKMIGRTDDLVVFSHGKKLNAAAVEMELGQCPGVAGVIVGGRQRARPFVLVEWEGEGGGDETRLDQLWAAMERINEGLSEFVRMQRELILPTGPGKKLVRNAKGGPARRASQALFAEETARLYSSSAFRV
jgi:acyl-coenzyme A synthetase/AMP-(fatty) acid ligase